jgi:FAD:protein FMN transferase
MRRSQVIMGTGVSVDIPEADETIFKDVFERLKNIDTQFSPYSKTSELQRFQRGEISNSELSSEMRQIIKACAKAEKDTNGYFSAGYSELFNPTGYIKGWAIAEAGKIITSAGYKSFCIGIGGDILAGSDGDKVWKVGIQNPKSKKYLTSQVFLKDGAVATSGNYERGRHIINPKTGELADELLSFSVVGPDIIVADVLATAGFAAGENWQKVMSRHSAYQALAINKNGKTQNTKNWRSNRSQESNQS